MQYAAHPAAPFLLQNAEDVGVGGRAAVPLPRMHYERESALSRQRHMPPEVVPLPVMRRVVTEVVKPGLPDGTHLGMIEMPRELIEIIDLRAPGVVRMNPNGEEDPRILCREPLGPFPSGRIDVDFEEGAKPGGKGALPHRAAVRFELRVMEVTVRVDHEPSGSAAQPSGRHGQAAAPSARVVSS